MTTTSYDVRRGRRYAALVALVLLTGCGAASSDPAAGGGPDRRPDHHATSRSPQAHGAWPDRPVRARADRTGTDRAPADRADRARADRARADLARLVVRPRPHGTRGYLREAFGSDWVDTDHDGCNQRDDVLLRDAVPGTTTVALQGACDHDVLAGTWHDPYTGHTLRFADLKDLSQAEAIQIDHVVPLAEAWVSGASAWDRDRREAFANDLGELLAVDGPTNMSKGDGDPAAWRPRIGYQCTYAERWVAIKTSWRLAADPSEVAALRQMLGSCA